MLFSSTREGNTWDPQSRVPWALQRDPSQGRGRTADHWKGRSGDPRAGHLPSVPLLPGRLPWAPEDGL